MLTQNVKVMPLHFAAGYGHTKIALFLIREKANVNAQDENGATPVHIAAEEGKTKTIRAIMNSSLVMCGNIKSKDGRIALHLAAEFGQTETALLLINAGGNINAKENNGWTPLYLAIWKGQTETALALIEAGADLHIRYNDKTALQIAIDKYGKESDIAIFMQEVMEKGGNKNQPKPEYLLRESE